MGIEIERKFLVVGTDWRRAKGTRFQQGYLNRDKERTVRVRLAGDHAFLTIKGKSTGAVRAEFEYAIPTIDAEQLLQLCDGPLIQKIRYLVEQTKVRPGKSMNFWATTPGWSSPKSSCSRRINSRSLGRRGWGGK